MELSDKVVGSISEKTEGPDHLMMLKDISEKMSSEQIDNNISVKEKGKVVIEL
ncbi:hypothetical protein A2U01_0100489 [Trifolium medium]|uniref:Uncharacterized protein n=1 Tax=Trifolium medium TaxID=97028 RepID=A0A392UT60_9FABA|nr:hypothetical protein [Trifolium medium]